MKKFLKTACVDIIVFICFMAALIYLAIISPVPFMEWHKSIDTISPFLGWLLNLSLVIVWMTPIAFFGMRMKDLWYRSKKGKNSENN